MSALSDITPLGLNEMSALVDTGNLSARGPSEFRAQGRDLLSTLGSDSVSDGAKVRRAAQEFESILVRMMLKQMRATVPEGGLMPKSFGRKIFEEFMDAEVAEQVAGRMGLGLSDAIVRQLSPALNASPAPPIEAGDKTE